MCGLLGKVGNVTTVAYGKYLVVSTHKVKPFSPANQSRYLCKQCRFRWDGSLWAVSPGSILFAIPFLILDWTPYLYQWTCLHSRTEEPISKLRGDRVNTVRHSSTRSYRIYCLPVTPRYIYCLYKIITLKLGHFTQNTIMSSHLQRSRQENQHFSSYEQSPRSLIKNVGAKIAPTPEFTSLPAEAKET